MQASLVPHERATKVVLPKHTACASRTPSVTTQAPAKPDCDQTADSHVSPSRHVDRHIGLITWRRRPGVARDKHDGRRPRCRQRLEQSPEEVHLGLAVRCVVDSERRLGRVGERHDLASFDQRGLADVLVPQSIGMNAQSARPSRWSLLCSRSFARGTRSYARSGSPVLAHSTKRRCTVRREENRGGKVLQREPQRIIQGTPSRQTRRSTVGQPPSSPGWVSETSSQCSSPSRVRRSSVTGSVPGRSSTWGRLVHQQGPLSGVSRRSLSKG